MEYLAHKDEKTGRKQALFVHLKGTAARAEKFATAFGAGAAGYFCGIMHDAGKYLPAFQRRIRGSQERVDHSTPGAQEALTVYRDAAAAFCIAGHHGGLPDGGSRAADRADSATLYGRMKRKVGDYLDYKKELEIKRADTPGWAVRDAQSLFFYIRMLFSALVDADYLDTEEFMKNGAVERGGRESLRALLDKLEAYIARWNQADSKLDQRRGGILRALMAAGESHSGLFSLTVPTGGGKTVSSMAFALLHAINNGMARIIYVIPYVSIIEQTQKDFEDIFGKENVVAHYANVEYAAHENGAQADRRYLAAENWDAPIVLTTAVQFFESLYANKPSRCRKLHNIANSVIIFDEAQMLPVNYLMPCVSAISQLVENYRCTAVLCTATQPSLDRLFKKALPDYPIRELCPKEYASDPVFARVRYKDIGTLTDEELAGRLRLEKQALCIVNTKRQAQRVFALLGRGENCFHLSTAMTPEHRRSTLDDIRKLLETGEPCRVVSTSLVEAGVNVDFPAVYRALAGLDSVIQAGGRCNREGERPICESFVYIFDTHEPPPQSILQNISAAKRAMRDNDVTSPEAVKSYFEFLYFTLKGVEQLDKKDIMAQVNSDAYPFASVAASFKLIDNSDCTVYVPRQGGEKLFDELLSDGPNRSLMRELGKYSVGVRAQRFFDLVDLGDVERVSENAGILRDLSLYDNRTGLTLEAVEGKGFFA